MKRPFVVQTFSLTSLKLSKFPRYTTANKYLLNPNSTTISPKSRNMNGYSLVIDISSDEEYARTSTPLKSLPLNMVGSLSDSSTEVFRGTDAELESSYGSKGSPRNPGLTPKKKKKFTRVSFKLPPVNNGSESDFYEEPDAANRAEPLKPCRKINVQPEREMPRDSLNNLDELTKPPEISREEQEHFERLALELEEEERQITYMTTRYEITLAAPQLLQRKKSPIAMAFRCLWLREGPCDGPLPAEDAVSAT